MATNSGGWLYEANGTPVDKATADNAQARVLEIKQDATRASADSAKALSTANTYAGEIAKANTTAGSAVAIAKANEDTVERYSDDVEGLKVNAGWNAGSPNDAQNAAFLRDPNSESHSVLNAQTADAINDETSEVGNAVQQVTTIRADVTVTVGSGGDFSTITAAIEHLTTRRPTYLDRAPNRSGGLSAEVRLLFGFVMAEQVFVQRADLGWITITSEDDVVPISRAALTVTDWGGTQAAFYGHENGILPVIDVLFEMDQSGTAAQQSGVTLDTESKVVFARGTAEKRNGIRNATYRGLNVHEGSHASFIFGDFSGAGNVGVRVANGSTANGTYAKVTDCGDAGCSTGGSHVNLDAADLSRNAIGIRAAGGATVSAGAQANVSGCGVGLYATDGAVISAPEVIGNDCATFGAQALHNGVIDARAAQFQRARNSGATATHGGRVSAQGANVSGSTTNGVAADNDGSIAFAYGTANNCGTGIAATSGGRVAASYATATGCGTFGAHANSGGHLDVANATLTGAGSNGIRARTGSVVNAQGAKVRRGAEDATSDLVVIEGATVNAHGLVGGMVQAANVPTAAGIIYRVAA